MQIMNVIFFSTVILSLNMVYFKSTALFMYDVTINLVPPNKSSLLKPKSATIAFIAFFLLPFFPSRSLHFSKLTQNILKIARIHQSSLIQLNKKLKILLSFQTRQQEISLLGPYKKHKSPSLSGKIKNKQS